MSKPKPQLTLFPIEEKLPVPDVSKLLNSGRNENITLAYVMLSGVAGKAKAIIYIFEKLFFKNTKWEKLWNEYEDHGVMTYMEFKIKDMEISCFESDGIIYLSIGESKIELFVWGISDVFDKRTENKIRRESIEILKQNKVILEQILP